MKESFYADVNNIADYIIRNYDHSCLAFNGKESGDLRQDCEDFFYYEKLNWCGCGAPEDVKREILKYFSILEWWRDSDAHKDRSYHEKCKRYREAFGVDNVYENPLLLALAYSMDAAGFTEHGSSIGGAWLTTEGEMFLFVLRNNDEILKDVT